MLVGFLVRVDLLHAVHLGEGALTYYLEVLRAAPNVGAVHDDGLGRLNRSVHLKS